MASPRIPPRAPRSESRAVGDAAGADVAVEGRRNPGVGYLEDAASAAWGRYLLTTLV